MAAWSSVSSPSASSEVDESASSFSGAERKTGSQRGVFRKSCSIWGLPTDFFGIGSIDSSKFGTAFLQLVLNLIFVAADFSCRNQSVSYSPETRDDKKVWRKQGVQDRPSTSSSFLVSSCSSCEEKKRKTGLIKTVLSCRTPENLQTCLR